MEGQNGFKTPRKFQVFPTILNTGKTLVLGEAVPKLTTVGAACNDVEVPCLDFSQVLCGYDLDQFFPTSVNALKSNWSEIARKGSNWKR